MSVVEHIRRQKIPINTFAWIAKRDMFLWCVRDDIAFYEKDWRNVSIWRDVYGETYEATMEELKKYFIFDGQFVEFPFVGATFLHRNRPTLVKNCKDSMVTYVDTITLHEFKKPLQYFLRDIGVKTPNIYITSTGACRVVDLHKDMRKWDRRNDWSAYTIGGRGK
jgi:hypothetical protein